MTFSETDFKHCLGTFATGVTVATTHNADNSPVGVTINSFSSVSLSPPLILFCLEKTASPHQSFADNNYFAINILHENQKHISENFTHPINSTWDNIDLVKNTKAPIIQNCIAYLECEKQHSYEGGDHTIFIGKVINLHSEPSNNPLLYYRGNYTKLK